MCCEEVQGSAISHQGVLGCPTQAFNERLKPGAPAHNYAAVSVSNVVATTCQYEALKYVSFPVQTLGKCAKMIPVMIWGAIIMRRSYKPKDYAQAVVITLGTTVFLMSGDVSSRHNSKNSSSSIWGIGLMLGYLGFDGFTSTFQDKLFKGYQMSVFNQMLYTNTFSAIFSLIGAHWTGYPCVLCCLLAMLPVATSVGCKDEVDCDCQVTCMCKRVRICW